jgi:hypothetical protein
MKKLIVMAALLTLAVSAGATPRMVVFEEFTATW